MKISNLFKKFRSQKGITGADVGIAVSIITTAVVVITMIYVNLDINQKTITRTAGATRIATNVLEGIDIADFSALPTAGNVQTFNAGDSAYNTKIPRGYNVVVKFESSGQTIDVLDLIMKVTVNVNYKVGKENKQISVSTIRQMNYLPGECNAPDLSQGVVESNPDLVGKTIVKIRYSHSRGQYIELQDASDPSWYSYSSKEWAQILAFDTKEEADNFFINPTTGAVEGKSFEDIKNYLYVWLPNFNKERNGSNIYFRYGSNGTTGSDTQNAIVYVVDETKRPKATGGKYQIGYYKVASGIVFASDYTRFDNDYPGTWTKYWDSSFNVISNDINLTYLSNSQYGPMNIY